MLPAMSHLRGEGFPKAWGSLRAQLCYDMWDQSVLRLAMHPTEGRPLCTLKLELLPMHNRLQGLASAHLCERVHFRFCWVRWLSEDQAWLTHGSTSVHASGRRTVRLHLGVDMHQPSFPSPEVVT